MGERSQTASWSRKMNNRRLVRCCSIPTRPDIKTRRPPCSRLHVHNTATSSNEITNAVSGDANRPRTRQAFAFIFMHRLAAHCWWKLACHSSSHLLSSRTCAFYVSSAATGFAGYSRLPDKSFTASSDSECGGHDTGLGGRADAATARRRQRHYTAPTRVSRLFACICTMQHHTDHYRSKRIGLHRTRLSEHNSAQGLAPPKHDCLFDTQEVVQGPSSLLLLAIRFADQHARVVREVRGRLKKENVPMLLIGHWGLTQTT